MLAWGAKLTPQERARVRQLAAAIGCDPSHLMACMAFETGETFSPSVKNPYSGAVGLIQFMPRTLKAMGYTVAQAAAMSRLEQLELVDKYFKPYRGRIKTLADCYMAIFWPAAIGKLGSYTLIDGPDAVAYVQNRGLDINKDGDISKEEAAAYVAAKLKKGMQAPFVSQDMARAETVMEQQNNSVLSVLGGVASLINPIAGIAFNAFSPLIQEKIAKEVDRRSDTPGVGAAVAKTLTDSIIETAKAETGRTDELEAVAVAKQDPAVMAKIETAAQKAVEERVAQLAPVLNQTLSWDKQRWDAQSAGRASASSVAQDEHKAGLWDMTKTLVSNTEGQTWFILVALAGGLVYSVGLGKEAFFTGLIGIAGGVINQVLKMKGQANDYRFDGTKESSEQTRAITKMATRE